MNARSSVRQISNTTKQAMDHLRVAGGRPAATEGRTAMNAKGWNDSGRTDRMTCGEAAYAGVTLMVEERLRTAALARRAEDRTGTGVRRSIRTRAGLAIVAFGTRVGGRALDRPRTEALPSPTLSRPARAGRAG
jgi:hypothetical protein